MPPSVTMSSRRRSVFGITAVIGSTPDTSTSWSCSTQPRMLLSSGASASTSASLTAMRARRAIWRTVAASTDMEARLAPVLRCGKNGLGSGGRSLVFHRADLIALGVEEADQHADRRDRRLVHRDRAAVRDHLLLHRVDIVDREGAFEAVEPAAAARLLPLVHQPLHAGRGGVAGVDEVEARRP